MADESTVQWLKRIWNAGSTAKQPAPAAAPAPAPVGGLLGRPAVMDTAANTPAYRAYVIEAASAGRQPMTYQEWVAAMAQQPRGLLSK